MCIRDRLRKEVDFKEFVIMNHFRAKSVQDLADMRRIDIRKFNKLFKETFNVPPYTWMLDRKAEMIEERLADPTVPFKDIMEEFRFSSPSHFLSLIHILRAPSGLSKTRSQ